MTMRRDANGGFTLIEVMIAILITGILFTGFFSIIRTAVNTQLMVREFGDAERVGPAILSQLRQDLHNAYFYNIEDNRFFEGRQVTAGADTRVDQIHFLTTRRSMAGDENLVHGDQPVDIVPGSPLTEVSWLLRDGGEGFYQLCRREQPFIDEEPFKGGYYRLVSDRVQSFKVQYTGWDLGLGNGIDGAGDGDGSGRGEGDGEGGGSGRSGGGLLAGLSGSGDEDEDGGLVWENDWSSEKKGTLPVAIKVELLISPDLDPDVLRRLAYEGRLGELDRSYVEIILLPQFREEPDTMRRTSEWTGTVQEPQATAGSVGGPRGGGRGAGRRGEAGGNGEGGRTGDRGTPATPLEGSQGGGNSRIADILRGAGR